MEIPRNVQDALSSVLAQAIAFCGLDRQKRCCYHSSVRFAIINHFTNNLAFRLLKRWPRLDAVRALELLDYKYPDSWVRTFACNCLDALNDSEFATFLPQLIQVYTYQNKNNVFLLKSLKNKKRHANSRPTIRML